jgi:hypothetical protein
MAMRYIGPPDQERIRSRFEQELKGDVRLVVFAQPPTGLYIPGREEPQTGRQTQALMEELAELSDKLHVEIHNPRLEPDVAAAYGVDRSPAVVVEPGTRREPSDGAAAGAPATPSASGSAGAAAKPAPSGRGLVRFFGLPSGYEFTTLLEDVVDVSRGRTRLSEASRAAAAALTAPLHLQVFVTPT